MTKFETIRRIRNVASTAAAALLLDEIHPGPEA
jgi:hypothetical protein